MHFKIEFSKTALKEVLEERLCTDVFFPSDIVQIIKNLGGDISEKIVRANLKGEALNYVQININPKEYGFTLPPTMYSEATVLSYLSNLDSLGIIDFKSRGISDHNELISKGYLSPNKELNEVGFIISRLSRLNGKAGIMPSQDDILSLSAGPCCSEEIDKRSWEEEVLYLRSQITDNQIRILEGGE